MKKVIFPLWKLKILSTFSKKELGWARTSGEGGHQYGKKCLCISGRIRPFWSYKKVTLMENLGSLQVFFLSAEIYFLTICLTLYFIILKYRKVMTHEAWRNVSFEYPPMYDVWWIFWFLCILWFPFRPRWLVGKWDWVSILVLSGSSWAGVSEPGPLWERAVTVTWPEGNKFENTQNCVSLSYCGFLKREFSETVLSRSGQSSKRR